MANAEPAAEIDNRSDRDAHERRDRPVRAPRAEERGLERRVHTVEGRVVPVEAAAGLRRLGEERQEHGAGQRLAGARPPAGVCLGEDRRRRLPLQLGERRLGIRQRREPPCARVEEGS